ncbi:MAG: hypothetical protein F6K26_31440 [Moorea sp. SIO2I5]|nr:hypothetical protein [Moorena sp. SIO2I5]
MQSAKGEAVPPKGVPTGLESDAAPPKGVPPMSDCIKTGAEASYAHRPMRHERLHQDSVGVAHELIRDTLIAYLPTPHSLLPTPYSLFPIPFRILLSLKNILALVE